MNLELNEYMSKRHKASLRELELVNLEIKSIDRASLKGKHNNIVVHNYTLADINDVEVTEPQLLTEYTQDFITFTLSIKEILKSLGFNQVQHKLITTQFWNYDFLDIPASHPDRNLTNSFHFQPINQISSKLTLSSHTTSSIFRHYIETYTKFKTNTKNFIIGTVFRRQREDLTHFIEFTQLEFNVFGNYTISQWMQIIVTFFKKLKINIKFKRSIYPYTQPSFDIYVIHNNKELELGGGGIFRQNIKTKLSCKVNMFGLGLGLERLFLVCNNLQKLSQINEL